MSTVAMTEILKERILVHMPYEILFEIFCGLPKGKLIEISRLCPKFKSIAGDKRLWKDVYIKYEPFHRSGPEYFNFKELYSEPWPVRAVDLQETKIMPPVSSQTDHAVKVIKLNLSWITADKVTMEAILAKYQCTELYLNLNKLTNIMEITPEVFSKQTGLEVLSLSQVLFHDLLTHSFLPQWHVWLAHVFSNCRNLKTLNLQYTILDNSDMLRFVKYLPTSLETLLLAGTNPEDSFFESLAESTPNLKELGLDPNRVIICPSLLKFQFLETLHFDPNKRQDINHLIINHLDTYLIKFPALRTIYVAPDLYLEPAELNFRKTLKNHGIILRWINESIRLPQWPYPSPYPAEGILWKVSKAV